MLPNNRIINNDVIKENIAVLFVEVSQHEPSTPSSLTSSSYLLQVFTVGKKHNMVYVRKNCGLESSISVEYTACVFRRLSENGCTIFIQNSIHSR